MKTLQELFDHAVEFATSTFNDKGEVVPMWLAQDASGDMLAICVELTDKDQTLAALRKLFKQRGVVRYACMIEAWTVTSQNGDLPESFKRGASLASHPDRTEIVMISAEDSSSKILGMLPILRPEHGKPKVGALKTMPGDKHEGRFIGLLTG